MSAGRKSWLPYEVAQRLRRDLIVGLLVLLVSAGGIALTHALTDPVGWTIDDSNNATLTDGTPCQLFRVAEIDAPVGVGVTMLDCGPRSAWSTADLVQLLLVAAGAAGALLVVGSLLGRVLAPRMPVESLALPVLVVGVVAGVALAWWGSRVMGDHLVYQVDDGSITSAVLHGGDGIGLRGGAVAAGLGLVAASFVRVVRG